MAQRPPSGGSFGSGRPPSSTSQRRPPSAARSMASRGGASRITDDSSDSDDDFRRKKDTVLDADALGLERPAEFLGRLNADDYSSEDDDEEEKRRREEKAALARKLKNRRAQQMPPDHTLHRRNSADIIEVELSESESDDESSDGGDFEMGLAEHYEVEESVYVRRSHWRDRIDAQVELAKQYRDKLKLDRRNPVVLWHEKQFLLQLNASLLAEHEAKVKAEADAIAEARLKEKIEASEKRNQELTEERKLWLEGDTLHRERARGSLEQRIAIKIPVLKNKTERRLAAAKALREERERKEKQAAEKALADRIAEEEAEVIRRYDADVEETQTILKMMRRAGVKQASAAPEPLEPFEPRETDANVTVRLSERRVGGARQLDIDLTRHRAVTCLNGVNLGEDGAKALAASLSSGDCPRLTKINLGWCGIKTKGAKALFGCFQFNVGTYVKEIDLRYNRLEAPMLQGLMETLNRGALSNLCKLDFRGNVLEDRGALTIAHAILDRKFLKLEKLVLQRCEVRDLGARALYKALCAKLCPNADHVDLRNNRITASCRRRFSPCPGFLQL